MEKTFAFGTIKRRLESIWARSGSIIVSDVANDFFLVRFSDPDDYRRAAFEGPWKIFYFYFSVARWTPSFNEEEPIKSILTWVRLPKLPIHYFNRLAVTRIGNCIGKTVRLDLATEQGARARYARVCVEVDLSRPLLGKYMLENRTFFVEYESLENICVNCGHYGHRLNDCPSHKPQPEEEPVSTEAEDIPVPTTTDAVTGEWMIVARKQRGRPKKATQTANQKPASGSRFSILRSDESAIPVSTQADRGKSVKSGLDTIIADQAAKLAHILKGTDNQASQSSGGEVQVVVSSTSRKTLADVTNVIGSSSQFCDPATNSTQQPKVGGPMTADSNVNDESSLISIPVTYTNPIFKESSGMGAKSKAQSLGKRTGKKAVISSSNMGGKSTSSTKGIAKPVRSFVSKQVPKAVETDNGLKSGKPPDRS
ncbi:hypothetical protein LINPERHAP1_LOCUS33040 [Linum perenne]